MLFVGLSLEIVMSCIWGLVLDICNVRFEGEKIKIYRMFFGNGGDFIFDVL